MHSLWFRGLYAVLDHGYLGVPLFFVISGFCIHQRWAKQYAQRGERTISFSDFWKRRMRRLYPPYLAALLISMALIVVAYLLGKNVPLVTNYPQPRPRWMAADFLAHLLMLHGLHPVFDQAGGNPPFWSLAREEYLYLMYFGLLAVRQRWGMVSGLTVVVLSGIAFSVGMGFVVPRASEWWPLVLSSAVVLWVQWTFGAVAVEAYYGLIQLPRWCSWGCLVPVWAAAAKACDTYFCHLSPLLWGLAFFTLLNYCIRKERTSGWPMGRFGNWLVKVGGFSYSLYLIHNPVRAVVKQMLGPYANTTNPVLYVLNGALMAVAGYYVARLFFHLIERRCLNAKPA